MAINYGQRWAIYLLMAQHTGQKGLRSHLRHAADDNQSRGMNYHDALVKAVYDQKLVPGIVSSDIDTLSSFDADDLRPALNLAPYYDPTLGDCPGPVTGGTTDVQTVLVNALAAVMHP